MLQKTEYSIVVFSMIGSVGTLVSIFFVCVAFVEYVEGGKCVNVAILHSFFMPYQCSTVSAPQTGPMMVTSAHVSRHSCVAHLQQI